jgi:hypothetical protein
MTSTIDSFAMAMVALTVYGIGKTFFWPTMLAVASDRFPRTGAVAISIMGGIGMMSAGMIGAPGLGYFKDKYSGEALERVSPGLFNEYKADKPTAFLVFPEGFGLDGKKLGAVQKKLSDARDELAQSGTADPKAAFGKLSPDEMTVYESSIEGDRRTLKTDSVIPATMAVIYLLLMIYFKVIGGYRAVKIEEVHAGTELGSAES